MFSSPPVFAETSVTVRVLVAENQRNFSVTVEGPYLIKSFPDGHVLTEGNSMNHRLLVPTLKGVQLEGEEWTARAVSIEVRNARGLFLNLPRFRGAVRILKDKNNLLYAVNQLNIEDYLYGVLHHEVAPWWPMEALKAQAVAARTYAFYQAGVSKLQEFDLKSGTSSQVYGGSTTERYRTKMAVDQTAGQVLTFQGKVFPAYFHATCAGITAAASELWAIHLPPLYGGVHCGFCRISPHYFWQARVPLVEIEEKLNKNGRPVGQILKIEIISQTPSSRVGSLKIVGTLKETALAAKDFRIWIGGDRMRSTAFKVSVNDDMAEFRGRGWGHGVGFCQWGALGQSLLGRKYQEILKFYYPGSEIMNYENQK